ncbi:MAG TPA: PBP1A family penicillin-binding protein [Beijerinckiaceae bacterium]|nr:PBP1A family penicillin-binding protein [Beijerinckiaceae bacterium]
MRSAAREALGAAQALGRHLGALLRVAAARGARRAGLWLSRFPRRMEALGRRSREFVNRPAAPERRRPQGWLWRTLVLFAASAFLAAAVAGLGLAAYCVATIPLNGGLQIEATQSALTLESDRGEVFATRGAFKGEKLTAADLPPHLAQAIIGIEDRRFYQHGGVDFRGMLRAAWRNAQAGATREGGSTITQQLARLMFLSSERTLRRKVQEALLALWLESQLSKEEILLRYLNTAFFGAGAYGIDAAAKRYFGKRAKELSLPEAAMLAGLVRAPSQLAPTRNFGGARERADVVLQAMVEIGAITPQEADAARAQPAALRAPPDTPPGTNYFVDMVTADVRRLLGGDSGDAALRTTLNLDLQRLAEGVIERRLEAEGAKKNVSQAALIAMAPDGAILALVGGRDYEQTQFNRAIQAKRQAGSLFKLFVYLSAFQRGYTPASVLVDRPVQIGDWEPQNYGGRFRGAVTLRTAFAHSINTIAVQLAEEVGVPAVIDTAKRMGLQSNLPPVPSLALGAAEVTLMEMTRAFAAVGAGVESMEPYAVRTIQGGTQQALYTRPRAGPEVTGQLGQSRAMMLDLLQAVVSEGTGKAARLTNVPAAGKTGTTQEYRDAWFIGFTPDLVVGVWIGNDDNTPMNKVVGGDMPARIWHDFVERAGPVAQKPPLAQRTTPANVTNRAQTGARVERNVRGAPEVLDTGTLAIAGTLVRLQGVEGEGGRMAQQLARFLRRREVTCEPVGNEASTHRCRTGGEDLAELILSGGGARATSDAPPELLAAEEQARSARLGIWRRYR